MLPEHDQPRTMFIWPTEYRKMFQYYVKSHQERPDIAVSQFPNITVPAFWVSGLKLTAAAMAIDPNSSNFVTNFQKEEKGRRKSRISPTSSSCRMSPPPPITAHYNGGLCHIRCPDNEVRRREG